MPKTHSSHFENIPKPAVDDLGHVLHQVLNKLELALDSPAYNYIIHTAPFDHGELPHYHWHIEIIPRLTKVAGFEWGSGFYINPVPPENAAGFLRDVDVTAAMPSTTTTRRATSVSGRRAGEVTGRESTTHDCTNHTGRSVHVSTDRVSAVTRSHH